MSSTNYKELVTNLLKNKEYFRANDLPKIKEDFNLKIDNHGFPITILYSLEVEYKDRIVFNFTIFQNNQSEEEFNYQMQNCWKVLLHKLFYKGIEYINLITEPINE